MLGNGRGSRLRGNRGREESLAIRNLEGSRSNLRGNEGIAVDNAVEGGDRRRGGRNITVTTRKSRDVGLKSRQRVKPRAEASIDSTPILLVFNFFKHDQVNN